MAHELAQWIEYLKKDVPSDQLPQTRIELLNLLTKAQTDLYGPSYLNERNQQPSRSTKTDTPVSQFLKT